MSAISVGVTATLVSIPADLEATYILQNLGTSAVYYGRSNAVTTATGLKVEPGGDLTLTNPTENLGTVYLISGTAGQDVRLERVG